MLRLSIHFAANMIHPRNYVKNLCCNAKVKICQKKQTTELKTQKKP